MYVCVRVLMKIVGWYEWNGMEMESRLGPASEAKSTQYSREVAKHLKESGAKMYGAFWCSHCEDQKETFGAGANIPYVVRRLFVFLDFLFFISTSFFLFLCLCFFWDSVRCFSEAAFCDERAATPSASFSLVRA